MPKPYDYLVFIGRFQPFHYGHAKVIEQALEESERVIILVGSANGPRSWRNPFTFAERMQVIHNWACTEGGLNPKTWKERLIILPLDDFTYNDQGWITAVQTIVDTAVRTTTRGWSDKGPKVGLIGHSKDASSYYLGLFPQWGNINVGPFTDRRLFNSTDVREVYFTDRVWHPDAELLEGIPNATGQFLEEFHQTSHFEWLYKEHQYVVRYKRDHAYAKDLPYEATHTTVDAVVVQSGHVLLIRRGTHPGKGQLCLPGGFIDPGETLLDGVLRELREETKIKVPRPVLAGNMKQQAVFDDPNRSSRGRVFSHTFLFHLPPQADGLPKVKAASDALAGSAQWVPLSALNPEEFFEDHYHIIRKMTAGL